MAKRGRLRAGGQGKRYTPAQKRVILAAAKKEGLTGAQVRERFGVSTLTFYRWRGPVRRRRRAAAGAVTKVVRTAALRREVRAGVARVLPQIIREEVQAALKELLR